jgi:hypothetical protein
MGPELVAATLDRITRLAYIAEQIGRLDTLIELALDNQISQAGLEERQRRLAEYRAEADRIGQAILAGTKLG